MHMRRYCERKTVHLFFFILFLSFSSVIFSQQVTWGFNIGVSGADYAQGLHVDAAGSIYLCGKFQGTNVDFDPSANTALRSSNGADDAFFAKYSSNGTYLFSVTFGGSSLDKVESITTDVAGNIYVTGFFRGSNVDFDPSPATALLTSNGDSGGDPGYGGDIFVAKYSPTGQYIWAFNVGGSSLGDVGVDVKTDNAGNVYVGGYFYNTLVDFDPSPAGVANLTGTTGTLFVAKYNTNGQYQWAFNVGSNMGNNSVFDMRLDAGGNLYVVGYFTGTNIDFDPSPTATALLSSAGNYEAFVAKYTSQGQYVFAFKIGGSGLDVARGLTLDNAGNIYILGDFNGTNIDFDPSPTSTAFLSSNGSSDIFIAKYTNAGQYVWAFNAGSAAGEIGWKIDTDNSSLFIAGGFTGTSDFNPGPAVDNLVSNGGYDIFLAKYDMAGNYQCAFNIGSAGDDFGYAIKLGAANTFYLAGSFRGNNVDFAPSQSTFNLTSAGSDDIFLVKYLWPPNTLAAGSVAGNTICKDGTGQLTFTASNGISPFTLSYTDGVSTFTQNNVISGVPFNVQVSPTVTTSYTVTQIQDAVRCSPANSVSLNATIIVDNAVMRTRIDTSVCKNGSVVLTTSGAQSYSWSPSTYLSADDVASPTATPGVPMQYIVTGTSANGCILKDTVNVGIYTDPVITISDDVEICKNSSAQLSISGGDSYIWSPGATLTNANSPNPTASPLVNTMYYVDITDINTCVSKDSVFVSIRPDAVFKINGPVNVCLKDSVRLSASGGDTYTWQPATGLDDPSSSSPWAKPLTNTTYSVTITESVCNQSQTLTTPVTTLPLPVVTATKSNDIDCVVADARLSASGAVSYLWSPAATLSNPNISNPLAMPVTTTDYIVRGKDRNGCANYDTVTVNITNANKGSYLMPTAFTPNNDGLNDCYGIKFWGIIQEIDFSVYNRWGERIFHTTDPLACWDGKYKGVPQASGVFVYVIKGKTTCEASVFRKGTFVLIR